MVVHAGLAPAAQDRLRTTRPDAALRFVRDRRRRRLLRGQGRRLRGDARRRRRVRRRRLLARPGLAARRCWRRSRDGDVAGGGRPHQLPRRPRSARPRPRSTSCTSRARSVAGCTRNFYANNVAFRRDVLERGGFGAHDFYRGSCQVLGLALQARGIAVRFAPGAHTSTACPTRRRISCASGCCAGPTPSSWRLTSRAPTCPRGARWLARLGPLSGLAVLAVRCACSLIALRQQRHAAVRGPRWFAGAALVAAFHAADAAGAVIRGLRLGLAAPARRTPPSPTTRTSIDSRRDWSC